MLQLGHIGLLLMFAEVAVRPARLHSGMSMADVFVSYARQDHADAEHLVSWIETRGFTVWWDAHLGARDCFRDKIQEELRGASAVVVIWTRRSVASSFVRQEAQEALELDKLVAVRQADLDVREIPLGFREQHTLETGERDKLISAIIALRDDRNNQPRAAKKPAALIPTFRQVHGRLLLSIGSAEAARVAARVSKSGRAADFLRVFDKLHLLVGGNAASDCAAQLATTRCAVADFIAVFDQIYFAVGGQSAARYAVAFARSGTSAEDFRQAYNDLHLSVGARTAIESILGLAE